MVTAVYLGLGRVAVTVNKFGPRKIWFTKACLDSELMDEDLFTQTLGIVGVTNIPAYKASVTHEACRTKPKSNCADYVPPTQPSAAVVLWASEAFSAVPVPKIVEGKRQRLR
eukprot:3954131-Lingulodinium_polyedra.AAC.1